MQAVAKIIYDRYKGKWQVLERIRSNWVLSMLSLVGIWKLVTVLGECFCSSKILIGRLFIYHCNSNLCYITKKTRSIVTGKLVFECSYLYFSEETKGKNWSCVFQAVNKYYRGLWSRLLLSRYRSQGSIDTCNHMNRPWKHLVKSKKPQTHVISTWQICKSFKLIIYWLPGP